jgi:TatD DNase family protein
VITGASVTGSVRALGLAATAAGKFFATAGIHPHHAAEHDAHSICALAELLRNPLVVAVGECGLDFYRNFAPREDQERAFLAQLELAASVGLPVFLHQRDAHERFTELLARRRGALFGGVAHCFTGGPEELHAYLDLGLYIGITGWVCDERRGAALRNALPFLPLDRLMIETDAPYLLPRDLPDKPRDRRNEPRHLPHILARVAAIMRRDVEEVAAATTANAERLFGLSSRTIRPAGSPA